MPKKGGLGQFADLRGGGLGKKEEVGVFEGRGEGVSTLMHTMSCTLAFSLRTPCYGGAAAPKILQ